MQLRTITARYGRKRQPAQYESAEAVIEFTLSVDEDGQIGNLDIEHMNMGQTLLGQAKNLVLRELGVIKPDENASVGLSNGAAQLSAGSAAGAATGEGGKTTGSRRRKTADSAPANDAAASAGASAPSAQATETQPATTSEVVTQQTSAASTDSGSGIPLDDKPKGETALGRTLPAQPTTQNGAGIPLGEETPKQPASQPQTTSQASAAGAGIPLEDGPKNGVAATPATTTQVAASTGGAGEITGASVQKYITTCLVQKKFLPNVVLGKLKNEYKVERVQDLAAEALKKFYNEIRGLAGEAAV